MIDGRSIKYFSYYNHSLNNPFDGNKILQNYVIQKNKISLPQTNKKFSGLPREISNLREIKIK